MGSHDEGVLFFECKPCTLQQLGRTLGFEPSNIASMCRTLNCTRQGLIDRLSLMHLKTEDGKYIRLVDSFVREDVRYIHRGGKMWSPTVFAKYNDVTWTPAQLRFRMQSKGETADEALMFLEKSEDEKHADLVEIRRNAARNKLASDPDNVPVIYNNVEYVSIGEALRVSGTSRSFYSWYKQHPELDRQTAFDTFRALPKSRTVIPWSERDDALLLKHYPSCGVNIPELKLKFTESAIQHRAARLGVTVTPKYQVIYNDRIMSWKDFKQLFHISTAIGSRLLKVFGTAQAAAERVESCYIFVDGEPVCVADSMFYEEDKYIHYDGKRWIPKLYFQYNEPDAPPTRYMTILNRMRVTGCSADEAVRSGGFVEKYTEEEDRIIRTNEGKSLEEVSKLLPGRSAAAIRAHAKLLGITLEVTERYAASSISRTVDDATAVKTLYTGTDGLVYVCFRCTICHRSVVLPAQRAASFVHSEELCAMYENPLSVDR